MSNMKKIFCYIAVVFVLQARVGAENNFHDIDDDVKDHDDVSSEDTTAELNGVGEAKDLADQPLGNEYDEHNNSSSISPSGRCKVIKTIMGMMGHKKEIGWAIVKLLGQKREVFKIFIDLMGQGHKHGFLQQIIKLIKGAIGIVKGMFSNTAVSSKNGFILNVLIVIANIGKTVLRSVIVFITNIGKKSFLQNVVLLLANLGKGIVQNIIAIFNKTTQPQDQPEFIDQDEYYPSVQSSNKLGLQAIFKDFIQHQVKPGPCTGIQGGPKKICLVSSLLDPWNKETLFRKRSFGNSSESSQPTKEDIYLKETELELKRSFLDSTDAIATRVIGGRKATITDYPYVASYGLICGAAILSPVWLLTAAHCGPDFRYIYAGSTFISRANEHAIQAHVVHPNFKTGKTSYDLDFDYQLLKLAKPLAYSKTQQPIQLGSEKDVVVGTKAVFAGWGTTFADGPTSNSLMSVEIPVLDQEVCKSTSNGLYAKLVSDRMFCAGNNQSNGTKQDCQGDSGGPLVYNGKLIGVVSFGLGCVESNKPAVFSQITRDVRQWIGDVTGLQVQDTGRDRYLSSRLYK